jgi:predicted metal-dependent HD superfamily phosphohydrolase
MSWSKIENTVLADYACIKLYDNELAGCFYHNSYHITEMYDYLEKTDEPYSEVLDWAVLFHDIVYDKGPDKELRSAEMFVGMSNRYYGCTLSEEDRSLVSELILATINHVVPMSADKKLFSAIIRADLHGLSSTLTAVNNFGKIMEESMILYGIDEVTYAKNSKDFMEKLHDRIVVNSVTDSDHSSFYDKVCDGIKFTADIAQLIQEKQK